MITSGKTLNDYREQGHINEAFVSDETPRRTAEKNNIEKQSKDVPQFGKGFGELTMKREKENHTILGIITRLRIKPPWRASFVLGDQNSAGISSHLGTADIYSKNEDIDKHDTKIKSTNLKENMMKSFQNESKSGSDLSQTNQGFVINSEDEEIANKSNILDHEKIKDTCERDRKEDKELGPKKAWNENPILWTQIFGAISSATVHLAIGCVVGLTGVILPSLMNPESEDLVLDKFQASIFSSIVNIGAIGGSILSSFIMTWLGQRSTLLVFLPVGMLFWIIMAFAQSFWLLVMCRTGQGIVVGICAGCANNYVVETAHKSVRGRLFATIDLALQSGFLFVYVVGSTQLSWRNVGLVCGIISMALPFFGMLFLPHSPRWLAMQSRKAEARKSLLFYRGIQFDVDSELNDIYQQLEKSSKGASVCSQLKILTKPSMSFRVFILGILLFASHFTGNFALIVYSVSIFQSADVEMNPYLSTIVVACVRIIGVFIYITVADKFGRRPLFMIPLSLSGLSMFALGLFFFIKTLTDNTSSISWIPLTSIIFYVLFTMMSHPVLMLLRSELLPTSVRSVGVGILYLYFFLGCFAVSISYPFMVDSIGSHWTFWLYGATSLAMVLITAISIPETQGKSLEDIQKLYEKKNKCNGSP